MHKSSIVLSIKNSSKEVLREYGDKVYLPFYQEYSLYLKNLHSQRAVVKVKIDGTDVLGGMALVIGGNDSLDLERFISNGNLQNGNHFKFVPVESHAADPSSPENGIIEVTAQFEAPWAITTTGTYIPPSWSVPWFGPYYYPTPIPTTPLVNPQIYPYTTSGGGGAAGGGTLNKPSNTMNMLYCSSTANIGLATPTAQVSSKGVTVEGSASNQSFSTASTSWLSPEIITLRLQILAPEQEQKTVDATKVKFCVDCGKKIKGSFIFCPKCGVKQEG